MDDLEQLTNLLCKRLFVELEASGRHVHVTKKQAQTLFGHDLREKRPLSQPGQYLAEERVSLVGPKGRLDHVAVLGPARREGQVEISRTDGRVLGLDAPVRLSGDVCHTPPIRLEGPCGAVELPQGVIVAQRHIHMTPEDAGAQNVRDGETVRLKTLTKRPLIFEEVAVRVRPDFATYVHLDFDEANACGMRPGDLGMILSVTEAQLDTLAQAILDRLYPRARLIGEPPPERFGYTYVTQPPWEAVVLGILPPGELLQMPTDPVCRALLAGTPVYLYQNQPYRRAKAAKLLQRQLMAAEEQLIQLGVEPLEGKPWS